MNPAKQIFDAFYDWILVRMPGAKVIRRRQNSPAPKTDYIVVDDMVSLDEVGTVSQGYRDETDFQSKVHDYSGAMALWYVGKESDVLFRLLSDLNLQESQEHFASQGVSIMSIGPVLPMPDLDDSEYREQYRVELQVAVAVGQTDESLTYIETVGIQHNIPGTQEAP